MEKDSLNETSGSNGKNVIVISNCCSANCPTNSGGALRSAATTIGGCHNDYNTLCECMDREDGVCRCGQRDRQIINTTWLRPQNWTHWPLIKRALIGLAVAFVMVWLVAYLILHFYVQAL